MEQVELESEQGECDGKLNGEIVRSRRGDRLGESGNECDDDGREQDGRMPMPGEKKTDRGGDERSEENGERTLESTASEELLGKGERMFSVARADDFTAGVAIARNEQPDDRSPADEKV